jgi:hypothetical protein
MFLMLVLSAEAAPLPADALVRALSTRDPIACTQLEASLETWRAVAQADAGPPWVPMRAAQCLLELHAEAVRSDLLSWVTDAATQGLGLLVLSQLDRLPAELALEVASRALAMGPDPDRARQRITASQRAEIRALVTP